MKLSVWRNAGYNVAQEGVDSNVFILKNTQML